MEAISRMLSASTTSLTSSLDNIKETLKETLALPSPFTSPFTSPLASPSPSPSGQRQKKVKVVDYRPGLYRYLFRSVLIPVLIPVWMDRRFRAILQEGDLDVEMPVLIHKFLHNVFKLPLHEVTRRSHFMHTYVPNTIEEYTENHGIYPAQAPPIPLLKKLLSSVPSLALRVEKVVLNYYSGLGRKEYHHTARAVVTNIVWAHVYPKIFKLILELNAELERDWHDLLSECGRRMQISDFQLPEELWKVKPEPPPPSDFTTPPLRIQSSLTYGIASNSPWAIFSGNSSSSSHSSHSGEFDIVDFSGEEEPKQDSDGGERKGNEIKDGDEDGTIDDNTVFTLEDLPELSETEPVNPVELISLEDFELLDENGPFTRDTTEEPTPITTTTTTTTTQAENTDSSNELASNSEHQIRGKGERKSFLHTLAAISNSPALPAVKTRILTASALAQKKRIHQAKIGEEIYARAIREIQRLPHAHTLNQKIQILDMTTKLMIADMNEFTRENNDVVFALTAGELIPLFAFILIKSGINNVHSEAMFQELQLETIKGTLKGDRVLTARSIEVAKQFLAEKLITIPPSTTKTTKTIETTKTDDSPISEILRYATVDLLDLAQSI